MKFISKCFFKKKYLIYNIVNYKKIFIILNYNFKFIFFKSNIIFKKKFICILLINIKKKFNFYEFC